MSIQGAMAASLRRFDPYPQDIVALDFAGVATPGRQFYKRNGVIVPRFEMLPGALSVGHGGLGQRRINGPWRPAATDEPLIGDGGLWGLEAREQRFGNPDFSNWAGALPAGVTCSVAGRVLKVPGVQGDNAAKIVGPFANDAGRVNVTVGAIGTGLRTFQASVRVVRKATAAARLGVAIDPISALVYNFDLSAAPLGEWFTISGP